MISPIIKTKGNYNLTEEQKRVIVKSIASNSTKKMGFSFPSNIVNINLDCNIDKKDESIITIKGDAELKGKIPKTTDYGSTETISEHRANIDMKLKIESNEIVSDYTTYN